MDLNSIKTFGALGSDSRSVSGIGRGGPQTREELEDGRGNEECPPGRSNREDLSKSISYSYTDPVRPTRAHKGRRGTVIFVAGLVRPASVYRPMARVVSLAIYRLAQVVSLAIYRRSNPMGTVKAKPIKTNKNNKNKQARSFD